jgi:nicotinamide-nucleotide amidase
MVGTIGPNRICDDFSAIAAAPHVVVIDGAPVRERIAPPGVHVGGKRESKRVDGQLRLSPTDETLTQRAREVMEAATREGRTVITAESCTAGLLSLVLSEAPGASEFLHGGFVAYTKQHKTAALGVPADVLARETAVSRAVAIAMAQGALVYSAADCSVAITGVAGPACDEDGNPVGLVHLAAVRAGLEPLHLKRDYGDIGRDAVRFRAVMDALDLLKRAIEAQAEAKAAAE